MSKELGNPSENMNGGHNVAKRVGLTIDRHLELASVLEHVMSSHQERQAPGNEGKCDHFLNVKESNPQSQNVKVHVVDALEEGILGDIFFNPVDAVEKANETSEEENWNKDHMDGLIDAVVVESSIVVEEIMERENA